MWTVFTAGDGERGFAGVTCVEVAEVCAAVRDDELERLRARVAQRDDMRQQDLDAAGAALERAEKAEAEIGRLHAAIHRALHDETDYDR
jgi:hypothetical protein